MPHLQVLAQALPWIGLLAFSVSLTWALQVVVGTLIGDDVLTLGGVREVSKVLRITVEGLAGSHHVYCATTTERAPFETVSVQPDQLMDVFHQLCSPQPGAS